MNRGCLRRTAHVDERDVAAGPDAVISLSSSYRKGSPDSGGWYQIGQSQCWHSSSVRDPRGLEAACSDCPGEDLGREGLDRKEWDCDSCCC